MASPPPPAPNDEPALGSIIVSHVNADIKFIDDLLPKLELLDEEEVEFLKETGSLHMPKYRSLMRRIADSKHSELHPRKSPRDGRRRPPTPDDHERGEVKQSRPYNQASRGTIRSSPPSIQIHVDTRENMSYPHRHTTHDETKRLPVRSPTSESPIPIIPANPKKGNEQPQQRIVLKDISTNTNVDLEKDILKREQAVGQRETEFLEKEKAFLTKENEFFLKEKELNLQIGELQQKLEDAEARAVNAEVTVLEMSSHLLQKEKDKAAADAVSDESVSTIQQTHKDQQQEWNITLTTLKESHKQEIEQLHAKNAELEKKFAALEADSAIVTGRLRDAEEKLRQTSTVLEKSENKAHEMAGELELARKTHEAKVRQLADEVKYHKDHIEQSDKRNTQLENQVAELKSNVESVYNKCIEKDEAIQQLKKSLTARQDDIETLRLQHAKESERQDKLQQQQQDLYERQLQASIMQVEMEFRKEYQQSAQKFHVIQRKNQERLKEMKRIREAYQISLHREAAAKAEVEKLQAILEDDKKKLFVEDVKRSDAFKAEIREEKAKRKELEQRLCEEQKRYAELAVVKAELDEKNLDIERLHSEIQALEEQRKTWNKLEDDLRAALKVKDVMLADQLRQIKELSNERQNVEAQFNDEIAEFQAHIEDLEAALDENLQKSAEEEVKNETLSAKLSALEKDVPKKDDQLNSLRSELEQKVSALEFLDQEMQRMRTVLENQDEIFQKRMQKHLEQQREEVERVQVGAEEERERQLHEWEAVRGEMMHKYEVLATEMENVAAQNAKLRVALEQEHRKTAQNDRDMRVLLAQIDRERQLKKENLRQIKSLFEQLQREAS
ncbi:Hypothetical protein PHPALM_3840 [Phytophthora palmivora]|uniref:Uncharacterized protein n=1 Tax=Phytophthora palmivora TaxID=4796 RepID=A0A2P4YLJ5_9STRA|nr:Hypothetical protein PHPALM_3840 [Phytophthora palmivora]